LAIRNFFSKGSSTGNVQRNCLRDPVEILAYLEELGRLGTVVDLQFADSELTPIPGTVGEILEAAGTCMIRCRYKPAKEPLPGQRVRLAFPLDKQRFLTDLGYQDRGSYLEYRFQLPSAVFHADRRDSVRARMLPHERLNILALQGLSAGLGLSGWLVDISMGGCCFLIHRAIQIKDEQRLAVTESLLPPGTTFDLVRLPNLPDLPVLECGGTLRSIRTATDGVIVGLRFEGLAAFERGILGKLLSERVPDFTAGFPHLRRIGDLTADELVIPQPAGPAEVHGELPLPGDPEEVGPAEDQAPLSDRDRLNRMRKRGKKILLVLADELDRILLMAMLHQDGYRGIYEARGLIQALEHNRRVPLDLVLVDQKVGHMGAVDLAEVLRRKGLPAQVPVVALQREPDRELAEAVAAGGLSLLLERPVDFAQTLKPALDRLLGL
jgi:CheY-like chemotaxis protein